MLNIANWLRRRTPVGRNATKLYGSIVTQARSPAFYSLERIPDTTNGRYEVLTMHLGLVLAALADVEGADGPLGRGLTEAFVTDMDDSMRELAIGDMAVPRKVKKAAAGLMERTLAYKHALATADEAALATTLAGYLDLETTDPAAVALTAYARDTARDLASPQQRAHIQSGKLAFPAPPVI